MLIKKIELLFLGWSIWGKIIQILWRLQNSQSSNYVWALLLNWTALSITIVLLQGSPLKHSNVYAILFSWKRWVNFESTQWNCVCMSLRWHHFTMTSTMSAWLLFAPTISDKGVKSLPSFCSLASKESLMNKKFVTMIFKLFGIFPFGLHSCDVT